LIVINDSPDESDPYRMLESFASRQPYVTVLENERNLRFVKSELSPNAQVRFALAPTQNSRNQGFLRYAPRLITAYLHIARNVERLNLANAPNCVAGRL
jgi:hypothetical protein